MEKKTKQKSNCGRKPLLEQKKKKIMLYLAPDDMGKIRKISETTRQNMSRVVRSILERWFLLEQKIQQINAQTPDKELLLGEWAEIQQLFKKGKKNGDLETDP